ncbi:MAG TPA: arginase family protein, partial [Actinomycetota bacterium]|nr:arginase family protein [Actinomycetota bacterium]
GVPTNSAGTIDGVARGPLVLREEGLVGVLCRHTEVHDYGDVTLPEPSPVRDPRSHVIDRDGLGALAARVRDAVAPILDTGHLPLIIGGDCPLLLGCLAAASGRGRIGLLFVDGHEDAYLPEQSSTGEAADMELAFALGMADASWSPELATMLPLVAPADVRILGPRDAGLLSTEGVASLRDRVALVDGERLAADPARIAAQACASLPDPWWFHLDLDVLSTQALPAIDYPQPGGLGWDELAAVASAAMSAEPRGWDVTIYNPDLDPERIHARRIVRFIGSVFERVSGSA